MDPAVSQMLSYLQQVAERLGIEGSRLWPQLVFATFVQSVALLFLTVCITGISAAVTAFAVWRWRRQWAEANKEYKEYNADPRSRGYVSSPFPLEMFWFYPMLIGASFFFIALMILITHLSEWAMGIYSPEVATVLNLVKSVKSK
jgi:hypothetical protein